MKYIIREYLKGDEKQIVDLLNLVFDGWPNFDISCKPVDHWRWKYLDNPLGGSTVVVAELGEEIVGVTHSLPIILTLNGERVLSSYISDTVVHPEHQRNNIFNRIVELKNRLRLEAGENFSYLVTSNPVLISLFDKKETHRELPREAVNLVRIVDIDEQLDHMNVQHPFLVKYGYIFLSSINRIWHGLIKNRQKNGELRIQEISEFDDRIDHLLNELEDCYDFMVKRDKNYLNWRYLDPRAGGYRVKIALGEKELLGYVVYKVNRARPEYPIGYIVDLLTNPERNDIADMLINSSLQEMDKAGVNITNLLITRGSPYIKAALRRGLIDSHAHIHAYTRVLKASENLENLYNSKARLHFTYGDIDTLPSEMPENINL